jgi:catechol-2,3-dioxygenase
MACRVTEIAIDCHDHERVGAFWAAVLGYDVVDTSDGLKLQGPDGSGPTVLVVHTPDGPKTTKNRLHLDVNATDRDQDAEVERILALGATRADIGQGDVDWEVLADPEGNEFCVLRSRVEPLD